MKKVTISREELYKEVWSIPMNKLAEKYSLSGNGLKKICLKHNIPVPYLGYWQRLANFKNSGFPQIIIFVKCDHKG